MKLKLFCLLPILFSMIHLRPYGQAENEKPILRKAVYSSVKQGEDRVFRIVVSGRNLSGKKQPTAVVEPSGHVKAPKVSEVTEDRLVVTLTAKEGYVPERVQIAVDGKSSNKIKVRPVPKRIEITKAEYLSSPPDEKDEITIRLELTGNDLYKEGFTEIHLSPQEGLLEEPVSFEDETATATGLVARARAAYGYRPQFVWVQIDDRRSDPVAIHRVPRVEKYQPPVFRSIMDPKNVSDIFGKRIAKRFVAIQVTIVNESKDHQFLIRDLSLDLVEILVEGSLIEEIENLAPLVTGPLVADSEKAKFQNATPEVAGKLIGRFLSGATIEVLNSEPKGLVAAIIRAPNDNELEFVVKSPQPLPPGYLIRLKVNKEGVSGQLTTIPVWYAPQPANLTSAAATVEDGKTIVTIRGSGFVPTITKVKFTPDLSPDGEIEVTATQLRVPVKAPPAGGAYEVRVMLQETIASDKALKLTLPKSP